MEAKEILRKHFEIAKAEHPSINYKDFDKCDFEIEFIIKAMVEYASIDFKNEVSVKVKEYLNDRINQLNKADTEFCELRWDMTKPVFERSLYREESNKVTFARQELQRVLKQFETIESEQSQKRITQLEADNFRAESRNNEKSINN